MDNLLPVYQHPALTVLIDDNQSFLDSLAFRLNPDMALRLFNDPEAAVVWLQHAYRHATQNDPIHVGYDEVSDSLERRNALIDLELICHAVTNRQRFELPAVLVIDYVMPRMNGIEFCEAIRDLPCKKILLTGQADDSIAIDAFNRTLIDRFIKKSDPDAMTLLESEIMRLQKVFFHERTSTLTDLLSRHSYAFLSDPAIGALVEQICDRYRFVEFYLFPNPEGMVFLDSQGKATLMVVATKKSLTAQLEVAQDQGAPVELLSALRELRVVCFFSDSGGAFLNSIGDNWLQYCLPPQICRGRQEYFWALFDFPSNHLPGAVYPYAEFLQNYSA